MWSAEFRDMDSNIPKLFQKYIEIKHQPYNVKDDR